MNITDISPIIPVVTLDDPATAVPLAQALAAGGVGILEVTLRTPAALRCISLIAAEVPEVVVGAGTLATPEDVDAAIEAGAKFLVSPGSPPDLARALRDRSASALPGCSTVTEAMTLRDLGFTELKFFPAEAAGGPAFLSAAAGPLPDLTFCPTGGITPDRVPGYLALPNVACVGGSWLTPASAIAEGAWDAITRRAAEAIATLRP